MDAGENLHFGFDDRPELADADIVQVERTEEGLVGTLIDNNYRVLSHLGSGGMSDVFRCQDLKLDRIVAVKVLRDGSLNPQALARFQREGKAIALLEHPGIVRIHNLEVSGNGQPYLVMEIVQGISLANLLATQGSLALFRVMRIASQISDALAHAHQHGVVHRDLKPSNIMLVNAGQPDEQVKLLDFGIAKIVHDDQVKATQTGEVFGTPAYMSPEQALGKAVDARADQYAVGCVIFELLTGRPPFVSDSSLAVIMSQVQDKPPRLAQVKKNLDVPSYVEQSVEKMLAKDPDERFADILEARDALLGSTPIKRSKPAARAPRTRTHAVAGAVIGLGLILIAVMWFVQRHESAATSTGLPKEEAPPEKGAPASNESGPSEYFDGAGVVGSDPLVLARLRRQLKNDTLGTKLVLPTAATDVFLGLLKEFSYASRRLRTVDLKGCYGVTSKGLQCLVYTPNVDYLDLYGCRINDEAMQYVKTLHRLNYLSLYQDDHITDAGIEQLKHLPLERLFLAGTSVDGSVFESPGNLRQLDTLNLDETKVHENLKSLRNLNVRSLFLNNDQLTDLDLDVLKRMTSLNSLSLDGNPITNTGLMKLSVIPNLRYVSVVHTNVTDKGAAKFEKVMSGIPGFHLTLSK